MPGESLSHTTHTHIHTHTYAHPHPRNVAAHCEDQALQNQVIMAAKQTALATQALIACTKVLAPCIDSPLCQEQLIDACKHVAAAVEKIVLAAQVDTHSLTYTHTHALCTLAHTVHKSGSEISGRHVAKYD